MEDRFEDHLKALEASVGRLESGEETLADSLEIYEDAVRHLRACHRILAQAEMRVRVLREGLDGELAEEEPGGDAAREAGGGEPGAARNG